MSSFMDRMKKERKKIEEKEERLSLIKKYYSRFGTKVVTIMMGYFNTPTGMARLFKVLDMPRGSMMPPPDQHNMVVNWLNAYGERRFLELHEPKDKNKPGPYAVKPIITEDLKKPLYSTSLPPQAQPPSAPTPAPPLAASAAPPNATIPSSPKSPSAPQSPIPLRTSSLPKPSPVPASSSAPGPSVSFKPSPAIQPIAINPPKSASQSPPAPASVKPADPTAKPPSPEKTLTEVERRSGKERRHNTDRRGDLEVVFRNRRFGGERRKGKDRRKNWKPNQ